MSAVLVTGAAGFIGSHFVDYFLQVDSKYEVISLDLLTYAGRKKNLELAMHSPRHTFVQGDIRDPELIARLIRERKVEKIVHFAAESHVDNSIADPGVFLDTNVLGTHNLLRCAYAAWMDGPGQLRPEFASARFVHISTDEVYGSLGPTGHFTETTPYAPNSPYSASKASSDHLVRSYNRTYGLNTITTNCSNNFGPRQHSEKLIPTVIRTALSGQSIPVYGKGQNVRDWLYVKDHVAAVHRAMESGKSGEVYNVGGGTELANLD
ncbi:MAG: dTDP-glucose 4,6-dehydratase, partial [Leptospiraceae bacterium]|nr:dTDP-glucose 4,6-dehydratase [Leptospiraceae bacterium]